MRSRPLGDWLLMRPRLATPPRLTSSCAERHFPPARPYVVASRPRVLAALKSGPVSAAGSFVPSAAVSSFPVTTPTCNYILPSPKHARTTLNHHRDLMRTATKTRTLTTQEYLLVASLPSRTQPTVAFLVSNRHLSHSPPCSCLSVCTTTPSGVVHGPLAG